jgi:hypothetical protein
MTCQIPCAPQRYTKKANTASRTDKVMLGEMEVVTVVSPNLDTFYARTALQARRLWR